MMSFRALHRDHEAAAMVEFLAAFMPLLLLFLCLLELTRFAISDLMLQRAAGMAARACAVIKDQPQHCDANTDAHAQNPNQGDQIQLAASEALRPISAADLRVDQLRCDVAQDATGRLQDDPSGHLVALPVAQSGIDDVQVTARYRCVVPLARDIVCGNSERPGSPFGVGQRTRQLSAHASFGHQGARFDCWYSRSLVVWTPTGGWEPPIGFEF